MTVTNEKRSLSSHHLRRHAITAAMLESLPIIDGNCLLEFGLETDQPVVHVTSQRAATAVVCSFRPGTLHTAIALVGARVL